tara:strand:- start:2165 stop:2386 length:222 start_codon:yes stop_codon:yes gene_type:complete
MNDFKIGDFVRSDTDDVFIGLVIGDNELGHFHVAWHDGDITYSESHRSMFHHKMKSSDWTPYLYKAFSDIFCP